MSPEDFGRFFCKLCRNPECVSSATGTSKWVNRMETQVDRLLDNPLIADPDDPRFAELRRIDFADAMRQAMAMEISERRGDWEIPTDADVDKFAAEMTAALPSGFQTPAEAEEAQSEPEEEEPEILWEGEAKGSKGKTYKVTLARLGDAPPAWSCTCPATQYGTAPPGGCKHVVAAMAQFEQQREEEVEVEEEKATPPPPVREGTSSDIDPESWKQMKDRNLVPQTANTRYPPGGLMADGSPPPPPEPEPDPWEAPPEKPKDDDVVPVGGSVKMGGGGDG
jgi:hypothetical protein